MSSFAFIIFRYTKIVSCISAVGIMQVNIPQSFAAMGVA